MGIKKNQMGLDLGYKVDVAAIPIKNLSKFPLSPLQNALKHCHDERGFLGEAFLSMGQNPPVANFLLNRRMTANDQYIA